MEGFKLWPRNFHMPPAWPQKKKKKKKKEEEENERRAIRDSQKKGFAFEDN